jgi:hypothetical protein
MIRSDSQVEDCQFKSIKKTEPLLTLPEVDSYVKEHIATYSSYSKNEIMFILLQAIFNHS